MSRPPRVIVVDPDPFSCEIDAALLHHAGFAARTAITPGAGLQLAREWNPAVIITEFPLAVGCHASFVEAIRAEPSLAGVHVLVATTSVLEHRQLEALAGGVDRFLLKPMGAAQLLAEVRTLVETISPERTLDAWARGPARPYPTRSRPPA